MLTVREVAAEAARLQTHAAARDQRMRDVRGKVTGGGLSGGLFGLRV